MPCVCPAAQLLFLCTSGISIYLHCWNLGTIFHTQVFLHVLCHFRNNCWIKVIHFCSWGDRIRVVIFFVQQKSQWHQGNRPTQYLSLQMRKHWISDTVFNLWCLICGCLCNTWNFLDICTTPQEIQCSLLDRISYCTQEQPRLLPEVLEITEVSQLNALLVGEYFNYPRWQWTNTSFR